MHNTPPRAKGRTTYLTAAEVADWLDVSEAWVYRKAREGVIPSTKLGRCIRFRPESVEAAMNGTEEAA